MRRRPVSTAVACAVLLGGACAAWGQTPGPPPLLPEPVARALAAEVSGTEARQTAQDLTLFHRMRGSRGYRAAAERVRDRLQRYGLADVQILELPADGRIFYGTQRSRPAWDAGFAELWELDLVEGAWVDARRIASYELRPVTLAQDSAGGTVTADLVDVGAGTSEGAYAGKDVRGKLVLVSAQPSAAVPLAVERYNLLDHVHLPKIEHHVSPHLPGHRELCVVVVDADNQRGPHQLRARRRAEADRPLGEDDHRIADPHSAGLGAREAGRGDVGRPPARGR